MQLPKITDAVTKVELAGLKRVSSGKVRDIYELGENLLIVTTDRLSAFDVVLEQGLPGRGVILTQLSKFWFEKFADSVKSHFISDTFTDFGQNLAEHKNTLKGRTMLVHKLKILPVECIVRGYLVGSGYKEYQETGELKGIKLPAGLEFGAKLPEPLFTPSTKAEQGDHDMNISYAEMIEIIGAKKAEILREKSLEIFKRGSDFAETKGIIIADTKFEFGTTETDEVYLADEVLTPDSSRFWAVEDYSPGKSTPSFDKQIVRDYLASTDWDKNPPAPALPQNVIEKTAQKYREVFEKLTS
ncbi:MAG: phosphoribosylaminoimidazolesuccinocarboxamide synthase [Planctomycetes bacterium]|nr:phosphoribosylaminoimidazolesuccinocarboxamide synthase [Planctomycetota bacterium]